MAIFEGNNNDNILNGTADNDFIRGRAGNDQLFGHGGSFDHLLGDEGNDFLDAGTGNDLLDGGADNDQLFSGAGDDILNGGSGDDLMEGELGNDIYRVDSKNDQVTEFANQGIDTIETLVDYTLPSNVENLALLEPIFGSKSFGGTGNELDNVITGNSGNNIIFGKAGNDTISGKAGNDFIFGDEGNDTIDGGEGNDILDGDSGKNRLIGGEGDDIYRPSSTTDTLTEDANSGIDAVETFFDFTLGNNLENLKFISAGTHKGTGNSLDNTLTGNAGNDTLNGLVGNDTLLGNSGVDILLGDQGDDVLVGGAGQDILTGGVGHDKFTFFNPTDGIDTIQDFNVQNDTIQISLQGFENGGFTGLQKGVLTGNEFHLGSSADNAIESFIYDNKTGALFFDRDGNTSGGAAQVQIARLTGDPNLTANNIVIV